MSYNAISNWPVDSIIPVIGTNKYITTFVKTYPMPTYLIGFVVSDFGFIEQGKQRVYAKAESIASGEADFALNDGIRILQLCEELWNVEYSPPKLYQVALPDFGAGGMEEWGLLTYREEALLLNNNTATLRNQETVLRLMSHEYAVGILVLSFEMSEDVNLFSYLQYFQHLWFGNLVSPTWWSLLWSVCDLRFKNIQEKNFNFSSLIRVKEAFGQFYAIYLTSLLYPDDRWMDGFVVDSIQNALTLDAHPNIRSMTHPAETPAELAGLFDVVAYDKCESFQAQVSN